MKGFAQLLGGFLLEYVPRRRNLSANTARSYRDSFVVLLGWLAEERGVAPDEVRVEDLSRDNVEAFCKWLLDVRGVCAATVGVRLCALRSFARYVALTEPAHLEWASSLRDIELPRSVPG